MYFQSIDDKQECLGLYYDSRCVFEDIDFSKLTRTWKYTKTLLDHDNIEYGFLFSGGKSIDEMCPDHMRHDWDAVSRRMNAFLKSLNTAKVDLSENCFFEIISPKEISRFLEIKNRITEHVFSSVSRPKEYEHLLTIAKMIEEIKHQEVVIDTKRLKADSYKAKNMAFSQTLRKVQNRVSYKLFGTKTGRLTVDKGYFPVLTLDKELRKYVIPNNDLFIEIDVNGAEIRTLLALLGEEQPDVDIHDWNVENVYKSGTREEAKKRFFAWLYNPASNDDASSDTYNRELIKKRVWDGEKVTTPFFREIDSDEYHCVNYTLQSTSNDVCLEQARKVFDILDQKKSKIAFLMHDSIILDFAASEKSLLREIIEAFRNTRFGQYRVNVNMGKNFGEMKEINWKQ